MSAPRVLVATLAIDYPAPARLPFELKQAGCDVALFAPAGSLAAQTPYVDRRAIAAGRGTTGAWTKLLLREIEAFDPAIVLPGDDAMVRMLLGLAIDPPPGASSTGLADLVRASLGDLALVVDSIDKTRLFEIARSAGMSVAEGGVASGADDAVSIAESLGYPVIVRAGSGTGGAGTTRCESADAVAEAVRKVRVPDGWMPARPHRVLVQRWVDGPVIVRASLAWHGDEVAGTTRGHVESRAPPSNCSPLRWRTRPGLHRSACGNRIR